MATTKFMPVLCKIWHSSETRAVRRNQEAAFYSTKKNSRANIMTIRQSGTSSTHDTAQGLHIVVIFWVHRLQNGEINIAMEGVLTNKLKPQLGCRLLDLHLLGRRGSGAQRLTPISLECTGGYIAKKDKAAYDKSFKVNEGKKKHETLTSQLLSDTRKTA